MDLNAIGFGQEAGNMEHKYDDPVGEFDPVSAILSKMESMELRLNALAHSHLSGFSGDQGSRRDGTKISGCSPTNSACCSGVSIRLP